MLNSYILQPKHKYYKNQESPIWSRNMCQVLSGRSVKTEVHISSQSSQCGISGGQTGTKTGLCQIYSEFSLSVSFRLVLLNLSITAAVQPKKSLPALKEAVKSCVVLTRRLDKKWVLNKCKLSLHISAPECKTTPSYDDSSQLHRKFGKVTVYRNKSNKRW
jgi:hypothetical protein